MLEDRGILILILFNIHLIFPLVQNIFTSCSSMKKEYSWGWLQSLIG